MYTVRATYLTFFGTPRGAAAGIHHEVHTEAHAVATDDDHEVPAHDVYHEPALEDVEHALENSNTNATGGYLDEGGSEFLVRSLGRVNSINELEMIVVRPSAERPVLLGQVARVIEAAQVKRGGDPGDDPGPGRPVMCGTDVDAERDATEQFGRVGTRTE